MVSTPDGLGIPDTIAGLVSLWDVSVLSTIHKDESNRVSQWDDRKGSNNLVQATGADQPLWKEAESPSGLDVIDFGSDWMDSAFTTLSQPYTLCLALDMVANGVDGFIHDAYAHPRSSTEVPSSNDYFRMAAPTNLQGTSTGKRGNWITLFYIFNGASSECIAGNTSVMTGNAGTDGLSDGIVFAENRLRSGAVGNYTAGEILLYNSALSSANIDILETYFDNKWGT